MVLKEGVMEGGVVEPPALPPSPLVEPRLGLEPARVALERAGVRVVAGWLLAATERRLVGLLRALLLDIVAGWRLPAAGLAEEGPAGTGVAS